MNVEINNIDKEQFLVNTHVLFGKTVYLINPQFVGCKFDKTNRVFRSSAWDENGSLISAGFPKFMNWGQQPDEFPPPKNLNDCEFVSKEDGSLLIVSYWNGQLVTRTRGTVDGTKLNNGFEIEILKNKYPKAFDLKSEEFSYLFEWVSPNQRIILDYGSEPDIYLIGGVYHKDYSLFEQGKLDVLADEMGVKRPKSYNFIDFVQLFDTVKGWKDREGVCVYSNNGQEIHKLKADFYLKLHYFKSNVNYENIVDIFLEFNRPEAAGFERLMAERFDFECLNMASEVMKKVLDINKVINNFIDEIKNFVSINSELDKKSFALKNIAEFKEKAAFVFEYRERKELSAKSIKKMFLNYA